MQTWNRRAAAVAVGIAVVIGGLGGAAIYAATNGGHNAMGTMHGGFPMGQPPNEPTSREIHGEHVESTGDGGFTTVLAQTGRITAITPTSVTARSADGFVGTYLVTSKTSPPLTIGDEVTITATRVGDTATLDAMRPSRTTGR